MARLTRGFVCFLFFCIGLANGAFAQAPLGNDQYAFKIYSINSGFYPIVQVYLRTWDQNRDPLPNVNYMNLGLMVRGNNYDPAKIDPASRRPQYSIETLQNREEAFRTVLVLDCSLSMAGKPFADAQSALLKYVDAKRPQDQIAVIAIREHDSQGYQLVSGFEKDAAALYRRISDIKCDGMNTRLYDSVAAAMELCATASQGGMSNSGSEHAILNSIVVLSDGKDEGSAVQRDELMNRIGQLSIPVPIFSLAYSNADRSSFLNLEALSRGSIGRYFDHQDSQELTTTVEKIHQINRSDYVVTFRSYVPVDGGAHPVRIGISWPSNTGRFVYDGGDFEAVDSPAKYVPEAKVIYDQLDFAYPRLATNCPYMDCSNVPGATNADAAASADPAALAAMAQAQNPGGPGLPPAGPEAAPAAAPAPAAVDAPPAAAAVTEPAQNNATPPPAEAPADFFRENGALLGFGAGVLALVIAILAWVKKSGNSGQYGVSGLPVTRPGGIGTDPRSDSSSLRTMESRAEKNDTTTRF